MITESSIYWILKLDDIRDTAIIFAILSAIIFIMSCCAFAALCIEGDEDDTPRKKGAFRFAAMSLVWLILNVAVITFTPSTKQMTMIKVLPAIANSEVVGEMSADAKEIYKMGIQAIKAQITKNGGK
jgi:hypothetical protein